MIQPRWYDHSLFWLAIGVVELLVVGQLLTIVVPATWPLAVRIAVFLSAWILVGTANYAFLRRARRR